jgi:hypothetical protein
LRDQEARRKAVMNAYLAAQKYCSTVECRRSTLLNYFGESLPNANCGKFLFIFAKDSVELSEGPLYVSNKVGPAGKLADLADTVADPADNGSRSFSILQADLSQG